MDRTIAITGASSGIGLALVTELAQPGHHLILLARRTPILETLAIEGRKSGARVTVHTIDLSVRNAWQEAYCSLVASGLTIDTIYHCAARLSAGAVCHTQPEDWQEIYRVNLLSTAAILATVYPAMVRRGQGTIVLFSSLSSLAGAPMSAPYGATKTAILGIWRSIQPETAHTGVSVHLVSPSLVDTPIFENFILRKVTAQQMRQAILATRLPITPPTIAARKIIASVAQGKKYIIFPSQIALYVFLVRRVSAFAYLFVKNLNKAIGIEK